MNRTLQRLILLFASIIFTNITLSAQSDYAHYIPPFFASGDAAEQNLVISTTSTTPANVRIYRGSTLIKTVTVTRSTPASVLLGRGHSTEEAPTTGIVGKDLLNKVLKKQSHRVESDLPIFCAVYHKTGVQGDILTCKGQSALGYKFYIGYVASKGAISDLTALFTSVMAYEDDTEITIHNPRVKYLGQSNNTITVRLNKNESYIVGADNVLLGTVNPNDFNGTKITSNKLIAINTGNWLAVATENRQAQDLGFDQIVPVDFMDNKYVAVKGNGYKLQGGNDVLDGAERLVVISASDSPNNIKVNGVDRDVLFSAGDYLIIEGRDFSANKNLSIEASDKIYVYQTLAGDEHAATVGLCFLPPTSDLSANRDIMISKADYFSKNLLGVNNDCHPVLNLISKKGASVSINGIAIDKSRFMSVLGNSEWTTYRIADPNELRRYDNNLANFYITSDLAVNASLLFGAKNTNQTSNFGGAGFYSGFENPIYAIAKDTAITATDLENFTQSHIDSLNNGSYTKFGTPIDSFSIEIGDLDCRNKEPQYIIFKAWSIGRFGTDTVRVILDSVYCNEPPEAADYKYDAYETPMIEDNLLKGVIDYDGSPFYVKTTPHITPNQGTVSIEKSGKFIYIPKTEIVSRIDSFSYVVCDNNECDTGYIYIYPIDTVQFDMDPLKSLCASGSNMILEYSSKVGNVDTFSVYYDDYSLSKHFIDTYRAGITNPGEVKLEANAMIGLGSYSAMLLFENSITQNYVMPLNIQMPYPKSILVQKWNNVIAIKDAANNGGYEFASFQWMRDGKEIPGATKPMLHLSPSADLDTTVQYSVLLTTADSPIPTSTCPTHITIRDIPDSNMYPTIVSMGGNITVVSSSRNSTVRIYDLQGRTYSSHIVDEGKTVISSPEQKGFFLLDIRNENGNNCIKQFIVK